MSMQLGPFEPPIILEIEDGWGGFALERMKAGGVGQIEVVGFHSFDEGIGFYKLLDNLNGLLRHAHIAPSFIDRLLLVVEPNTTTLYVNRMFGFTVQIRAKRPVNAGEPIGLNDIAGIALVHLVTPKVVILPHTQIAIRLHRVFGPKAVAVQLEPLLSKVAQQGIEPFITGVFLFL